MKIIMNMKMNMNMKIIIIIMKISIVILVLIFLQVFAVKHGWYKKQFILLLKRSYNLLVNTILRVVDKSRDFFWCQKVTVINLTRDSYIE